ncbi:MAG: DUF1800 domain-containing protein [Acidobacteria bacterium]|nr:DUF1800 domain-containing protein [Acidobacteriota bacterium]
MTNHHGVLSRSVFALAALGLVLIAPTAAQMGVSSVPQSADTATVAHVLNRLGYGARPGDIARVKQMTVAAYIEQQLHPEHISDATLESRLAAFPTLNLSTTELARDYFGPADALRRQQQQAAGRGQATPPPTASAGQTMVGDPTMAAPPTMAGAPGQRPGQPGQSPEMRAARQKEQQVLQELMQARVLRAATSERQLEEVLVDFWFNHFNVFSGKGQVRSYLTEYEREAIRPHVLGNFRDMLGAVAESPAMLFYLDNFQSVDPKAAQRQADAQEARQQQQAARGRGRGGLVQADRLQQQRNRGLNENYGRELMELHTLGVDAGYTQDDVIAVARAFTGWTIDRARGAGKFKFDAAMHDRDPKVVMGQTIKAGGKGDGEAVLDLLASHPSTARFIATKLVRRLVADEPPTSLVDRVAKVFLETKGDLREVTRAIITSQEFFSTEARHAKVKTPLEFVVSAIRATGADLNNPQPLVAALRTLGMPLYGAQPPTGWGDTAVEWVNTGALLNRLNFAVQLSSGQMRGVRVDVRRLAPNTSESSREGLINTLLMGDASSATRDTLAVADSPQQLIALTLGSPEFQKK